MLLSKALLCACKIWQKRLEILNGQFRDYSQCVCALVGSNSSCMCLSPIEN